MQLSIPELLNEIARSPDKVAALKQNNCLAVRDVLYAIYNPEMFEKMEMPEYKACKDVYGVAPGRLIATTRFLQYLTKDSAVIMKKKQAILRDMLESLCREEAELVEAIVQGKAKAPKALTPEIINAAFGDGFIKIVG